MSDKSGQPSKAKDFDSQPITQQQGCPDLSRISFGEDEIMSWFHKQVTVSFMAAFSLLTQELAAQPNSYRLAPLEPPNSERFFSEGRQQFEEEIRRWPQRRELSENNLLQIEEKFRKKFSESLREQGVQSLEDLTIPSQP